MIRCTWSFSGNQNVFEYVGETWDSAIVTMFALLPKDSTTYTLSSGDKKLLVGDGEKIFYAHRVIKDSLQRL